MKKISVIVPVYNVEKYVAKCIESIINQSYRNLEILLLNDGSTDGSGAICDEYAKRDKRIRVIHKENSGLSATRNLGVELSTGEYIAFIDSDDYISNKFLKTLYNMIEEENCDIASVDLKMIREEGYKNVTSDDIKVFESDSKRRVYGKEDILRETLLRKSFKTYVCTKLYKREVFDKCKFKEGISYEDSLFTYETSKFIEKIAYLREPYYFYIKRNGSITAICSEKNLNDFLDVMIYRYNDIKERKSIEDKYNIFALLESVISVSIKYVISKQIYTSVIEKSRYIFNVLKEYMSNMENEKELLPLLNESQKTCLYLILYNEDLFYNFLSFRNELKKNGKFNKLKKKPRICLVCDIPNWAFDLIAQNIQKDLAYKYDIKIDYFDMYKEPDMFFECLERNKECDLIHIFWRKSLLLFNSDAFKEKVKTLGMSVFEYINEISKKISTGVYDFLYLDNESIEKYKDIFNNYTVNYYVTSKKLYDKYINIAEYKKPIKIIHDVCNMDIYKPYNLERFNSDNVNDRPLVVGWVGNSERKIDGIDLKGLHTIIKPVISRLKDRGYNIKEHYADRNVRWRNSLEMAEYYSELDVCLCTSIHEGTPLPLLEGMSCGVPFISTDVGIVPEVFGDKQKEFIIGDRENGNNDEEIKNILEEKLIYLYNNRETLNELSKENIESIDNFDKGERLKYFEEFFDNCLNS